MQQVSLRSAVIFFNGQTDVRETFTETNSPIKIPEVATWKEKGFMWGGGKGVSVITERISSNSILKIITLERSTTEGCVYICSVGPLSNANSSPYCSFLFLRVHAGNSCKQSAVLFSRAGQVRVCAAASQWVSVGWPIGAI